MATYDAFISYSHARDKPVAAALQSVVQTLGKPWYRRRALRVFRDDTSLSATPELWPSIEQALGNSRFLILLASPEAAASTWVDREIAHWIERNGIGTLLIAVTDGEPAWDAAAGDFARGPKSPLPPSLTKRFASEPKWVDLRPYREGTTGDRRFLELGADFAAAIHGMPKEDLLSEEVRQQRRALMLAWSAVAALVVLAGAAAWEWRAALVAEQVAVEQRNRAEAALARAEALIDGTSRSTAVIGDMFDSGSLPTAVAQQILDVLRGTFSKLVSDKPDPGITPAQIRTLDVLSRSHFAVGHIQEALATADTARGLAAKLTALDPGNDEWQNLLAQTHRRTGIALRRQGKVADALAQFQVSRAITARLSAGHPGNKKLQRELALDLEIISDTLKAQGDLDGAHAENAASMAIYDRLGSRWDVANSLLRSGDIRWDKGELDRALAAYRKASAINAPPAEASTPPIEPERNWKWSAALSYLRVANALRVKGETAEALAAYRDYQRMAMQLEARDPVNEVWQRHKARSHAMIGDMLFARDEIALAAREYEAARTIARSLIERDARNRLAQQELAQSHRRLGEILLRQARAGEALGQFELSLKLTGDLIAADPSNVLWREDLAVAHERMGDALAAAGKQDGALEQYRMALRLNTRLVKTASAPRAVWQANLARVGGRIGALLAAQDKPGDARAALAACLAIEFVGPAFDLRSIGPHRPLDDCRRELTALDRTLAQTPTGSVAPSPDEARAQ
jgi:tetratricopeptide (TPR) repeat protein